MQHTSHRMVRANACPLLRGATRKSEDTVKPAEKPLSLSCSVNFYFKLKMSSEVLNSTTMYDPPLRHSRTLSRASMNSQQTEELLPRYPTAAPLSTQTSTETLRGPPQKSEEVKKQLGEGGQLSVDGFVYEVGAPLVLSSTSAQSHRLTDRTGPIRPLHGQIGP